MKTAISMPDDVFQRVSRAATERGLSRSELISTAVKAYLDTDEASVVAAQIDAALLACDDDDSSTLARDSGRSRLAAGDW